MIKEIQEIKNEQITLENDIKNQLIINNDIQFYNINSLDYSDIFINEPADTSTGINIIPKEEVITDYDAYDIIMEFKKFFKTLKHNLNSDNFDKMRNFLIKLTPLELKHIERNYNELMPIIYRDVFTQFDDSTLYTVFNSYKVLLIEILKNETIKIMLKQDEEFLKKSIGRLEENMKNIIENQIKNKRNKKNMKTRLKTEKKFNELKNKIDEIKNKKTNN